MQWLVQHFSPIWIIWFIPGAVVAIVVGAAVYQHIHDGDTTWQETIGMRPFTLLAIVAFVSSFLGSLLTNFSSPTSIDWWQSLAVRTGWQFGGTFLLVAAIVIEARDAGSLGKRSVRVLIAVAVAIGLLLVRNPVLDLLEGPVVLHGKALLVVEKWKLYRRGVSTGRGIEASVDLTTPAGKAEVLEMSGWMANQAEDKFAACERGSDVKVTVLRHVEAILDVVCR